MIRYADSHEWIRVKEKEAVVGISHYAQGELGAIVYVELPIIGKRVKAGEEVAVVESTKAATDIYSPISGRILRINEMVKEDPTLINRFPEKEGWLVVIALEDSTELEHLLPEEEYLSSVGLSSS